MTLFSVMIQILRIIGISFLILLGAVICILLLCLFFPIRYRLDVSYGEGEKDISSKNKNSLLARFRITWFWPFTSIKGGYREGVSYRIRVLGCLLDSTDEEERKKLEQKKERKRLKREEKEAKQRLKKEKKNTEEEMTEEHRTEEQGNEQLKRQEGSTGTTGSQISLSVEKKETKENDEYSKNSELRKPDSQELAQNERKTYSNERKPLQLEDATVPEEDQKQRNSKTKDWGKLRKLFQKIKQLPKKLVSFFHKVRYTILTICDRIKMVFAKMEYYIDLWESALAQKEWQLCKTRVITLLKHILPGKWNGYLRVGFEDPATTGKVMEVYGILFPLIGQNVTVCPVFDEEVLEATFHAKGCICLFTVIRILLQFYFDKDLKRLCLKIKKGGK